MVDAAPSEDKAIIALSFLFVRLYLYAVNGKQVPVKNFAVYVWSTVLLLTYLSGVSDITKRNITEGAGSFVFLVLMRYTNKPGLATREGSEHTFGIIRTIIQEFTPMEFVQLIENTTCRLNLIFRNGFGTSCDPQKGCALSLTDFIELSRDESPPVRYGSVEIDPNISLVVEQLLGAVGKVMSYTSRLTETLFNTVGVTAKEQSPFCMLQSACPSTC